MKNWEWKSILVGVFLFAVLFVVPAVMVQKGIEINKGNAVAEFLTRQLHHRHN